ncbi:3-dehydroquinate synthase II family protein [Gordonia sp. HNM0687]|uniref:3-dehydroquinate synthase II family protein n=1 Tax=Gordonia mangrovi TaxID=2665643 RepID=A0A6L7GTH0_9ACTN|nr:3-dehydroquinate synthase II family protein [Gordonia mangrovi]MXP23236.1 3-dehydroquinate synthase II family protein [Gordonia mangrovi]UVF76841.1 3-dehydroquinate synthase II [Gordonia mangrovi]
MNASTDIVTDDITPLSAVPTTDTAAVPPSDARSHFAWIDIRGTAGDVRAALVQAAIHHRIDGIVSDDADILSDLPPTVRRVLAVGALSVDPDVAARVDIVLADHTGDDVSPIVDAGPAAEAGVHVAVSDADTLRHACETVRRAPWTLLTFTDPTKIPLEIVIAAAENSGGATVTVVNDIEDAGIVKLVLEHGSDGLLLAPRNADDVATLADVIRPGADHIELGELTVTKVEHIGMGERACIDTCSLLAKDEGCLIGSFSTGMFLSCSETHPLPYMPTRPFRWNAGAVHSYVLVPDNRTRYVSELQAGQPILAVRSTGEVREVRIGRVKIERRPLISVTATTSDGRVVNVIAQDDWHVRLLGPGGSVNNVTDLKPGDKLLGHAPPESRHVGLPITEFCDER